jgi:hypothetical protein
MLDLFITVIAYLFIPTIFCIVEHNKRHSYNLKTIKKITIINGACIWFVLQIIRFYSGETEVSISGVLLWSFVAYWMMKKFLLEKDIELKSDEAENNEKIEFEIVDKNEKKRSFKVPLIIVSILLILSFALNLYQLGIQSNMEDSITQSNNERIKNSEKLDFFDNYVALVVDDGTGWYHKYECRRFKGKDFWAYNIDQAENLGYEPCPYCYN